MMNNYDLDGEGIDLKEVSDLELRKGI